MIGIGAGAYTQTNFAVIQANIEPKDAGAGITLMLVGQYVQGCAAHSNVDCMLTCGDLTAQLSGLAFGLSIAGALFLNLAQNALKILLPDTPLSEIQQIISGTSGGFLLSLFPELRQQALNIIVDAWRDM